MTHKVVCALCIFAFMLLFWFLLWTLLESDKIDPGPKHTPQHCADIYRTMSANVKSKYTSSEEFINSCVD